MNVNNLPIYNTKYGKFVLDPKDGVCNHIEKGEFWDSWLLEYYDKLTKDMVVVDAGCHLAQGTIYLANKVEKVYSFEPQKINFDRAVKNCELNDIWNVSLFNVALYSKNCKMAVQNHPVSQKDINYEACQACSLSLYENENGDIEARTLDSFNIEKVDFIKVDCETQDFEVIKGGIETIKRNRPIIIFEYDVRSENVSNTCANFFKELNYSIREIAAANFLATPK